MFRIANVYRKKKDDGSEYFVISFMGFNIFVFQNNNKTETWHSDYTVTIGERKKKPENNQNNYGDYGNY